MLYLKIFKQTEVKNARIKGIHQICPCLAAPSYLSQGKLTFSPWIHGCEFLETLTVPLLKKSHSLVLLNYTHPPKPVQIHFQEKPLSTGKKKINHLSNSWELYFIQQTFNLQRCQASFLVNTSLDAAGKLVIGLRISQPRLKINV